MHHPLLPHLRRGTSSYRTLLPFFCQRLLKRSTEALLLIKDPQRFGLASVSAWVFCLLRRIGQLTQQRQPVGLPAQCHLLHWIQPASLSHAASWAWRSLRDSRLSPSPNLASTSPSRRQVGLQPSQRILRRTSPNRR